MTSDIQVFESPDFGRIRTLDVDGVPYWVAVDVAKALGYKHTHNAITMHARDSLKRGVVDSRGRTQNTLLIPEADVYRLIVHSKLPEAQKFERWVFEEILPQIRRTGAYLPVPASPADGATDTNVGCKLPDHIADLGKLAADIAEIKALLTPKKPTKTDRDSLPAYARRDRSGYLLKKYVNAALDLVEELSRTPRTYILHETYKYIGASLDLDEIKAVYLSEYDLNETNMLDVVLWDAPCASFAAEYLHGVILSLLNERCRCDG